jgi:hypothetical protein
MQTPWQHTGAAKRASNKKKLKEKPNEKVKGDEKQEPITV